MDAEIARRLEMERKRKNAKLTDKEALLLIDAFRKNVPMSDLTRITGMSKRSILDLVSGATYQWLDRGPKASPEQALIALNKKYGPYMELLKKYGNKKSLQKPRQ